MLPVRYLGRVWTFAFQRFTIRTDAMQVVAASLFPLLAPHLGIKNPSQQSSEVLAYIGMVAIALIVIRLVCATYFIWKEDQSRIGDLEKELSRPERREEEAGLEHRIALRRELGEKLAELVTMAEFSTVPETLNLMYRGNENKIIENKIRIREIITLLSYDVALRVTCINLENLCLSIMLAAASGKDTKDLISRLLMQRKLTFKLLHRDDDVNDFMTMIEIENLIREYGETFDSNEPVTDQRTQDVLDIYEKVCDMAKQLGPDLRLLGKQSNMRSPNRG